MADVVNLNRARKKKRSAEKENAAAQNRVKFGRTKAEREKVRKETDAAATQLDRHRLTDGD